VVLINTTSVGPREIADHIADFMFKKSFDKIEKFEGDLSKYVGTYKGRGRGYNMKITIDKNDSTLTTKMDDKKPVVLYFAKDNSWNDGVTAYLTNYLFKETDGQIKELRVDQTYGYYILKKE